MPRLLPSTFLLKNARGGVFLAQKTISPRGVLPRVPVGATITAKNVQLAYVYGSEYQIERIEEWNRINRESFRERGAKVRKVRR